MQFTLPWPPATNNLFATVKTPKGLRRIPSRAYKQWLADAACALGDQRVTPVKGSFHFWLAADRPDWRKRDLDGLLKAPLDLLVKEGIVEDDSLAVSLVATWSAALPSKPGAIHVCVEASE